MDGTRVDRWVWAVRLYKTRSAATGACKGGHVRVNGTRAKPSTLVRPGDRVTAQVGRERVYEVVRIVDRRGSAAQAAECFIDHSPAPPPRDLTPPSLVRDAATGRPTKRDRRQLDRVRNR